MFRVDAQIRERIANYYIRAVTSLGLMLVLISLFGIKLPSNVSIYFLLAVLIGVTEYYPVPIWKGVSALSFPLVYTMVFIYGLPLAIVTYALILFIVNTLTRRPLRLLAFTPAQLVISLGLASASSEMVLNLFPQLSIYHPVYEIAQLFLFTMFYYIFNNTIVDVLLWIRPQPYTWKQWRQKSIPEGIIAFFAFSYTAFMFILGSEDRGKVDVFSFLFFFSPLVACAYISAVIGRLQQERNRLRYLFSITTELNRILPSGDVESLSRLLKEFLGVQASMLWAKVDGEWQLYYKEGRIDNSFFCKENYPILERLKQTQVVENRKGFDGLEANFFDETIRSLVFSPLIMEEERIGVLAVGKTRTHSFLIEDVQSMATLSNHLAGLLKTRMLISEQERRVLLEERNRIAREIHDGIAQSLAGAILKLESAQRLFHQKPEQSLFVIKDSIWELRASLKEVRQSIYALRPYPTEQIGLKQAIERKLFAIKKEYGLEVHYQQRGKEIPLSSFVEKVIFDTLQEAVQNVIKHANAKSLEILLSYQKEHVLLKIKDDGAGFSLADAMIQAKQEPHYGILHMNEQAERLGASLHIDSGIGKGTEIKLIIPHLEAREGLSS